MKPTALPAVPKSVTENSIQQRTLLLIDNIARVDTCLDNAHSLIEGYRFSILKKLKKDDLMFRRSKLTEVVNFDYNLNFIVSLFRTFILFCFRFILFC